MRAGREQGLTLKPLPCPGLRDCGSPQNPAQADLPSLQGKQGWGSQQRLTGPPWEEAQAITQAAHVSRVQVSQ